MTLIYGVKLSQKPKHAALYRLMDDDSTRSRVGQLEGAFPLWSPDGTQLLFEPTQENGAWIAEGDGSRPRRVYREGAKETYSGCAWSGSKAILVAVLRERGKYEETWLRRVSLESGKVLRDVASGVQFGAMLNTNTALNELLPRLSPDGLAFLALYQGSGAVRVVNLETGAFVPLQRQASAVAWLDNQRWLTLEGTGPYRLREFDRDGRPRRQVTFALTESTLAYLKENQVEPEPHLGVTLRAVPGNPDSVLVGFCPDEDSAISLRVSLNTGQAEPWLSFSRLAFSPEGTRFVAVGKPEGQNHGALRIGEIANPFQARLVAVEQGEILGLDWSGRK